MATITENTETGTGDVIGVTGSRASRTFDVTMDAITEDAIVDHIQPLYPEYQEHPKYPGLYVSFYEKPETGVALQWQVIVVYEPISVVAHRINEWQVTFRVNSETERLVRSIQLENNEAQAGRSLYDGRIGPTLTKDTPTQIIGPAAWRAIAENDFDSTQLGSTIGQDGDEVLLTVGDGEALTLEGARSLRRPDGIDRLTASVSAVLTRQIPWSPYPSSPATGSGLNLGRLWQITEYKTTVNNAQILGADAHTLLFTNFEASQNVADIDGTHFDVLDVSLEFMFNPNAWTPIELFDSYISGNGFEGSVVPGVEYAHEWPGQGKPISTWYPIYHESSHQNIFQLLGVTEPSFVT
jgi:hypothetical protein